MTNSATLLRCLFVTVALTWFHTLAVAAAAPDLRGLERNPHWLPEKVKLTVPVSFGNGLEFNEGDEFEIQRLERGSLYLWQPGANATLSVTPDMTTLLADAAARFDAWTPEQQAFKPTDFKKRSDLWPLKVTIRREESFSDGTVFKPGEQWPVTEFDGKSVRIIDVAKNQWFPLNPRNTDFYDQVIDAVANPRPARLLQELSGSIVRLDTGEPVDLLSDEDAPPYLAIYYAAGWCGYCAQTTPVIMEWYNESRAAGDDSIELVLVSRDKSEEEMVQHIADKGLKGFGVPFGQHSSMVVLRNTPASSGLPYLFVIDREGKVVIDSSSEMPLPRTERAIREMKKLQAAYAAAKSAEPTAPEELSDVEPE